ncbi:MAG: hypothetical protein IKP58_16220 [Victivallales bacterium]|nr:hypothetical protein [Victivallales bacterium]
MVHLQKMALMVAALLVGVCVHAQLGMKLESEQDCYLRFERVRLRLTVRNYSGNTLVFGGEEATERGKLTFVIRRQSGQMVKCLDLSANPMSDIILAPGVNRQLVVDINTLFDMQRPDVYKIEAHIDHHRLPHVCASEPILVEVREGNIMKERIIGLPMKKETDQIRNVNVKLMQFTDSVGSIWCLRVEDDELVYGVFRLGPFMGSSVPQMDVDGTSAIHILIQVGPHLYSYSVFSMVGEVVKLRQQVYYVADGGYPLLSRKSGYLKVEHARVAQQGKDYNLKDMTATQPKE